MLKALLYTAARPTEVWEANVENFDPATGTLRFTTAKGDGQAKARALHLTADAITFFKAMARSKTPKAPLWFTPISTDGSVNDEHFRSYLANLQRIQWLWNRLR